jgi:hypothetical protein
MCSIDIGFETTPYPRRRGTNSAPPILTFPHNWGRKVRVTFHLKGEGIHGGFVGFMSGSENFKMSHMSYKCPIMDQIN